MIVVESSPCKRKQTHREREVTSSSEAVSITIGHENATPRTHGSIVCILTLHFHPSPAYIQRSSLTGLIPPLRKALLAQELREDRVAREDEDLDSRRRGVEDDRELHRRGEVGRARDVLEQAAALGVAEAEVQAGAEVRRARRQGLEDVELAAAGGPAGAFLGTILGCARYLGVEEVLYWVAAVSLGEQEAGEAAR